MPLTECPSSIHFVGIGGIGMSGLARLMLCRGVRVTGSDLQENELTESLRLSGARIVIGHAAHNVGDVEAVAYSTAIKPGNPELEEARRRGIPLYHRSEVLECLVAGAEGVAVTGTHGKTTTAGMLGWSLVRAGLDPTVLVGGVVHDLGSNARGGQGRHAVFEADESDRSFHNLHPTHAIITNIESDHLDQYGTLDAIVESFAVFMRGLSPRGACVLCVDCGTLSNLRDQAPRPVTYGLNGEGDYSASNIEISVAGTSFDVLGPEGELGRASVRFPGRQYAANSLAAIAMALQLGVDAGSALESLRLYRGTARRFERLGTFRGADVVDDYAHHPTEVRATIQSALEIVRGRLIVVFQPHLFSRTRFLLEDFAASFDEPDFVILTGIYAAREDPSTATISGEDLASKVRAHRGARPTVYVPQAADTADLLADLVADGDTVLLMGAGDIREVSERLAGVEAGHAAA